MLTTLLFALEIKFVLKVILGEFNGFFIIKQIEKWGETLHYVFLPTLLSCSSRFLRAL